MKAVPVPDLDVQQRFGHFKHVVGPAFQRPWPEGARLGERAAGEHRQDPSRRNGFPAVRGAEQRAAADRKALEYKQYKEELFRQCTILPVMSDEQIDACKKAYRA